MATEPGASGPSLGRRIGMAGLGALEGAVEGFLWGVVLGAGSALLGGLLNLAMYGASLVPLVVAPFGAALGAVSGWTRARHPWRGWPRRVPIAVALAALFASTLWFVLAASLRQ